jgi:regulatory protein
MSYATRAAFDGHRKKRRARSVTHDRLEHWASRHLERYSCSAANLKFVLKRRVKRVEVELETEFPEAGNWIDQIVNDLVARGYLNDLAYAITMARQMRTRGSSGLRIEARLLDKGVSRDVARSAIEQASANDGDLEAASRYARRRRLGPYRADPEERRVRRDRDLAALGRSGFSYEVAARIIDADA